MIIKVLTFNKFNGKSEIAVIDSDSINGFGKVDAIRRLISDVELTKVEEFVIHNHSISKYDSEYWTVIVTT